MLTGVVKQHGPYRLGEGPLPSAIPSDCGKKPAPKSTKEPRMTSELPSKTPGQKFHIGRSWQTALKGRSIMAEPLGGQEWDEPHTVPLHLEMAGGWEAGV